MKLSIIIPVYNEEKTLEHVVLHVHNAFSHTDHEILIVDDGSTDSTPNIASHLTSENIFYIHKENEGKGSAVRQGLLHASGDYIAIQDADLEYQPETLYTLWSSITHPDMVIYGKRSRNQGYILNRIANYLLSSLCNLLYSSSLYDIYTCYKIIPSHLARQLHLVSNGFEIEAEITAKILLQQKTILEIPISYQPRTHTQGKKIRAIDALRGVWTLVRYRLN